ncbi:MAG: hypothetical protein JNJ57_05555 [Saprospiraceae bacterium]|nr:hypothetical protein [Saprospiraceae bacterium]
MDNFAKTRKELAAEYGIDTKTLQRWCEKGGILLEKRERIKPKMVAQIYEKFGRPITPDYGSK